MQLNISKQKQTNYIVVFLEMIFSRFTSHFSLKRKVAFTLAEVLITLGIIGVVAALALPTLIEQHEKKATAVKLEKFYSIMSQAVLLMENKDGIEPENFEFPEEVVRNGEKTKIWFDENLKPYISSETDTHFLPHYFLAKFNDGTGFVSYVGRKDVMYFFYCTQFKYCAPESYDGRRTFLFSLRNGKFYTSLGGNYLNRASLLDKCKNPYTNSYRARHYCTQLIQYDGWQIKDDYPWREN